MAFLLAFLIEPSQVVMEKKGCKREKMVYVGKKSGGQGKNNEGICGGWWKRKPVIIVK